MIFQRLFGTKVSISKDKLTVPITEFHEDRFLLGLSILRVYGPLPLPMRSLHDLKDELEILDNKIRELSKLVSPLLQQYGVLKLKLSEIYDINRSLGMNLSSLLAEYRTLINRSQTSDAHQVPLLNPEKIQYIEAFISRYVLREKRENIF